MATAEMTTFSTRMDKSLKAQMDRTAQSLGLTTAAAINVFARKFVATGGFPFAVVNDTPTKEEYEEEMLRRLNAMRGGHETVHELIED